MVLALTCKQVMVSSYQGEFVVDQSPQVWRFYHHVEPVIGLQSLVVSIMIHHSASSFNLPVHPYSLRVVGHFQCCRYIEEMVRSTNPEEKSFANRYQILPLRHQHCNKALFDLIIIGSQVTSVLDLSNDGNSLPLQLIRLQPLSSRTVFPLCYSDTFICRYTVVTMRFRGIMMLILLEHIPTHGVSTFTKPIQLLWPRSLSMVAARAFWIQSRARGLEETSSRFERTEGDPSRLWLTGGSFTNEIIGGGCKFTSSSKLWLHMERNGYVRLWRSRGFGLANERKVQYRIAHFRGVMTALHLLMPVATTHSGSSVTEYYTAQLQAMLAWTCKVNKSNRHWQCKPFASTNTPPSFEIGFDQPMSNKSAF